MRRIWFVVACCLVSACGASSPTAPSAVAVPVVPLAPVTQTLTGTISAGSQVCTFTTLQINDGPCAVYPFTMASGGRLDADLAFDSNASLLVLELFDPSSSSVLARGALTFDAANLAHSTLSANMNAGSYQLRVVIIDTSAVTSFTVTTTHPG